MNNKWYKHQGTSNSLKIDLLTNKLCIHHYANTCTYCYFTYMEMEHLAAPYNGHIVILHTPVT